MNFISKFFVLFAMLNLLSVNPALAESNPGNNLSNVQEAKPATSENASAKKNGNEALEPERIGTVHVYEQRMAFSYGLDSNGKLKVRDLYTNDTNKEDNNNENEQDKNIGICSYHQITSVEISNYGDDIIIQLAGKDEEAVEEELETVNCDEEKSENESEKAEVKDNISPRDSDDEKVSEDIGSND